MRNGSNLFIWPPPSLLFGMSSYPSPRFPRIILHFTVDYNQDTKLTVISKEYRALTEAPVVLPRAECITQAVAGYHYEDFGP